MNSLPLDQIPFDTIKLIATDMDGTLTQEKQFSAEVVAAIAQSPVPIVIVTGRSAGWVSGLRYYLPIAGAIAENGGVFYSASQPQGDILSEVADVDDHRQELNALFEQLQQQWPQLTVTPDNSFRLTDWTFDIDALSGSEIEQCLNYCQDLGWGFTYGTAQGHLQGLDQNKADGVQTVLKRHFPKLQLQEVLTIGDSRNDGPMLDPATFPISVGVANIMDYREDLNTFPRYLTTKSEGAGFCELLQVWRDCL